ncbi:MAG: NADH-quinone oxidoreductase subunit L [Methylotetracoccus sp.]
MHALLALIPLFPLLGFLVLVLGGTSLPRRLVPWIGAGSVGLAALCSASIGIPFLAGDRTPITADLWTWIQAGGFHAGFSLYLDALSLAMLFVVSGVGFLIHVYSAGFMAEDPGYARFFAYMNLFVTAMLMLVLADNLVLLYLGWEGVGLCSYLLIGFWYDNPANGLAARKAFVMTRVGDTAMALGLFLLFRETGSLQIQQILTHVATSWSSGDPRALLASLLLLGGAVGKSAQLPLQTWLPDAMAGPTPISALIHAATMVTAGVYLIARTHGLFELAPPALELVALIGVTTLLMAGFTALTQHDIKRILAYSTISQIGYMFLALGVGAWSAAIFHLMTHAYFKALLFLAAGAVIHSYHHEHDIFKMGGLRKRLPVTFWSFMIGSAALVAVPFTSGYFSKHEILLAAYGTSHGFWIWAGGCLGALLTGIYSFRLVFVAFFGPENPHAHERLGFSMTAPLVILGALALFGGLFAFPLDSVFGDAHDTHPDSVIITMVTTLMPLVGIAIAVVFFLRRDLSAERLVAHPLVARIHAFWFSGFGVDALYRRLFVDPFVGFARINRGDAVDEVYHAIVAASRYGHLRLAATQSGQIRWYAAVIAGGVVAAVALGLWS